MDQIGSNWIKLNQIGSNWIKLDQIGSKWHGLYKHGLRTWSNKHILHKHGLNKSCSWLTYSWKTYSWKTWSWHGLDMVLILFWNNLPAVLDLTLNLVISETSSDIKKITPLACFYVIQSTQKIAFRLNILDWWNQEKQHALILLWLALFICGLRANSKWFKKVSFQLPWYHFQYILLFKYLNSFKF